MRWLLIVLSCVACGRGTTLDTVVPSNEIRIVSYNIRHGRGMDDSVDLARTARVLRALTPDIVGLQEVDVGVARSGRLNEPAVLGELLSMRHRFGAFMQYQGGQYGLALLSRFPILAARSIELPTGNEPRVALIADLQLPARSPGTVADTISVIVVHFDWVADDGFRYAQASRLTSSLDSLEHPYLLLGDFNDEPVSRTLSLFRSRAAEVGKEAGSRLTFSSTNPVKEIDFVFTAPALRWRHLVARSIDEPAASDHRPVLAVVSLLRR